MRPVVSFLCSCVPEAAQPIPMASSTYIILPDRMNQNAGSINLFSRDEFQMTGYEISLGRARANYNFINASPAMANDEPKAAEQALNTQVAGKGAVLPKHADGYLP